MKRMFYKIAISFTVLIMLGACKKDYLNTYPTNAVASSSAFTTTTNALMALNGIHRSLYIQYSNQDEGGQGTIGIDIDCLGEDLVFTGAGSGWFKTTSQWVNHRNVNSALLYYVYRFYYKVIANANMIINNIDAATGSDDKKNIKGQALAYRAWAHFNLVQLFGQRYNAASKPNTSMGVPIMLTNITTGIGRSSVEDVYTQINADLDAAIGLLGTVAKRPNKSHISVNVAQGFKARVALTQQDWTNASKYAILARSGYVNEYPTGYTLMTNADYQKGFSDYTNVEWMWGSHVQADQTQYFYSFFAYMSENYSTTDIRANCKAINSLLYNTISATDVRKKLWDPTGTAFSVPLSTFVKQKYMNIKFLVPDINSSCGDYPMMRAGEMYLIEAEAKAQLGDNAGAATALYTMAVNRDPSYVKSTNTGAALISEILTQRRVELWGEGFRFFDLKRLNVPLNRNGANHNSSYCVIFDVPAGDVKWQFLLPKAELDANPSIANQQNPLQ